MLLKNKLITQYSNWRTRPSCSTHVSSTFVRQGYILTSSKYTALTQPQLYMAIFIPLAIAILFLFDFACIKSLTIEAKNAKLMGNLKVAMDKDELTMAKAYAGKK